jgi:UDP-glucose 4-epimerase
MSQKILVTGGAGYIGSHTAVQLLVQDNEVVIFDNLCNSSRLVLSRIKEITKKDCGFIHGDVRDRSALRKLFQNHSFDTVIHFAGLKAVGESEDHPLMYYDNNVLGSIILFEEMIRAGVSSIVFSSSATVYGDQQCAQYKEDMGLIPINVYGKTKLIVENILRDLKKAHPRLRIAILRYFNPVGAHPSGLIGENPLGVPNNLMPVIAQVSAGKRPKLLVYGDDYETGDGTGLRDYIHVEDLAAGHVAALDYIKNNSSLVAVNLGSGKPHSVLEVVRAFERASGVTIPFEIIGRRPGDLAEYYADPSLAKDLLGWTARHTLDQMCQDTFRWQKNNPRGYE